MDRYADLKNAFGSNLRAAENHWLTHHHIEDRDRTCNQVIDYSNSEGNYLNFCLKGCGINPVANVDMFDDDHPTLDKATQCFDMFQADGTVDPVKCKTCSDNHCSADVNNRAYC